jgi:hypothetical protein
MKYFIRNRSYYILLLLFVYGCVEEIDLTEELSFEDTLVIEANITDESKEQVIAMSRSYRFEDEGANPETNASVSISANEGKIYSFTESDSRPGLYVSDEVFKAEPGVDYRLFVTTSSGASYTTPPVQLPQSSKIDRVYGSREVNSIGTELLAIKVDSYDPTRSSNYYRYEYEETYKIIAPNWVNREFVILQDEYGNDLAFPGFETRSIDEKECYNTDISNSIIQTSTTELNEDRVSGFAVRNIASDNPVLSHRYSILVRQYVQSLEAFSYYDLLNQLSASGNALTQIQPGFIASNIFSTTDRDEKVLGFFDVSSVAEERIFFNYEDFFPGEPLPPYFVSCRISAPPIATMSGTPLKDAIQAGLVKYLQDHQPPEPNVGPFDVVPTPCGDCTVLGQTDPPEFWIE